MNLKECYEYVGGDYGDVISRLVTEQRVIKFVTRVPGTEDYPLMMSAFAEGRWEEAFRHSHTLKGLALNLGLSDLAAKSSALCETVRNGPPAVDLTGMLEEVKASWERTCVGIAQLEH